MSRRKSNKFPRQVRTELKGLPLAVVVSVFIAALSLVIYAVFNESVALLGLGVAGFVFIIVILEDAMKSKQRPGEQVNF